MNVSVKTRVDRILKKLPAFRACEHLGEKSHAKYHAAPLEDGETLLGIYESGLGVERLVLFSDQSVHWMKDQDWHSVKYRELGSVDCPVGDKMAATELLLRTRKGDVEYLPIHGGTENTRDLYEVWRFLLRVTEDLEYSAKQ